LIGLHQPFSGDTRIAGGDKRQVLPLFDFHELKRFDRDVVGRFGFFFEGLFLFRLDFFFRFGSDLNFLLLSLRRTTLPSAS
jgi:hypothetical protein